MKIIRISKCEDCPYFEYAYSTDNFLYICEYINIDRRAIYDKTIIQDFCPLEEEGNDKYSELITDRHG